jgi:hypothetical protein
LICANASRQLLLITNGLPLRPNKLHPSVDERVFFSLVGFCTLQAFGLQINLIGIKLGQLVP